MGEIEKLLKEHDWWHMMSDDPSNYDRGVDELAVIRMELKSLSGAEAVKLWNKYCPEKFKKTIVNF